MNFKEWLKLHEAPAGSSGGGGGGGGARVRQPYVPAAPMPGFGGYQSIPQAAFGYTAGAWGDRFRKKMGYQASPAQMVGDIGKDLFAEPPKLEQFVYPVRPGKNAIGTLDPKTNQIDQVEEISETEMVQDKEGNLHPNPRRFQSRLNGHFQEGRTDRLHRYVEKTIQPIIERRVNLMKQKYKGYDVKFLDNTYDENRVVFNIKITAPESGEEDSVNVMGPGGYSLGGGTYGGLGYGGKD